ncbi:MAG TPA: flippase [Arcobacter sp.]|nr:flippase [Arcobacter sp.]
MIKKLKRKLSKDLILTELLKGSSLAFIFRIIGIGIGYIFTLLIARWYGADTLGLFIISLTLLNIFTTISIFGFDTALVKYIAKYNSKNQNSLINEVYQKALIITIILSSLISLFIFYNANYISSNIFNNNKLLEFIEIISFAILPFTYLFVNLALLRGLKKITLYAFFKNIAITIVSIILLILLHFFIIDNNTIVIYSQFLAIVVSMIMSFYYVFRTINISFIFHKILTYKKILKVSFPMLLTSSMILVMNWSDILMLGMLKNETDVGIYSIAVKIATLITVPLMAVNVIIAPKFSEFYANNNLEGLNNTFRKATKLILLTTLPIIFPLVIFSENLLELYGEEFTMGLVALWILIFGQFVNAVSGPVGIILNMTNYHKLNLYINLISIFLNLILNYFLILEYGIYGAAIATSISMVFQNLTKLYYIKKIWG